MRILISAFSISPEKGSESAVGWEFTSRLACHHQVTVLYGDLIAEQQSRIALEAWMRVHPEAPSLELVYVPSTPLIQFLERLHSKPGLRSLFYAGYRLWQQRALAVARLLHAERPFQLAHQLTFATYREPGYLWKLGIPFFWGPFSGGNTIPLRYIPILGLRGSIEAVGRWVLNRSTLLTHPRIPAAARRASHLWCVTGREQEILAPYNRRSSLMMEVGPLHQKASVRTYTCGETLQLVWSGVHVPRKALPLLLRAVARLPAKANFQVHILGVGYGRGEETERAKKLAEELGISKRLQWHGELPREEALDYFRQAHALVHTSLLEATSTVLLEALSLGLPVLCHDACGMATTIDEECGIKVPMTGIEGSVRGFAQAVERLLNEPGLVERLSRGTSSRLGGFDWNAKIEAINDAYARAIAQEGRSDPLRFGKEEVEPQLQA